MYHFLSRVKKFFKRYKNKSTGTRLALIAIVLVFLLVSYLLLTVSKSIHSAKLRTDSFASEARRDNLRSTYAMHFVEKSQSTRCNNIQNDYLRDSNYMNLGEIRNAIKNSAIDNDDYALYIKLLSEHYNINPALALAIIQYETQMGGTGPGRPANKKLLRLSTDFIDVTGDKLGDGYGCNNLNNMRDGDSAGIPIRHGVPLNSHDCVYQAGGDYAMYTNYYASLGSIFHLLDYYMNDVCLVSINQLADIHCPVNDDSGGGPGSGIVFNSHWKQAVAEGMANKLQSHPHNRRKFVHPDEYTNPGSGVPSTNSSKCKRDEMRQNNIFNSVEVSCSSENPFFVDKNIGCSERDDGYCSAGYSPCWKSIENVDYAACEKTLGSQNNPTQQQSRRSNDCTLEEVGGDGTRSKFGATSCERTFHNWEKLSFTKNECSREVVQGVPYTTDKSRSICEGRSQPCNVGGVPACGWNPISNNTVSNTENTNTAEPAYCRLVEVSSRFSTKKCSATWARDRLLRTRPLKNYSSEKGECVKNSQDEKVLPDGQCVTGWTPCWFEVSKGGRNVRIPHCEADLSNYDNCNSLLDEDKGACINALRNR